MRERLGEEGTAGPFEELPALMVVLIAISLFSVSVAHATMSRDDNQEYITLQEDCRTFASMVRSSHVLCGENPAGIYNLVHIQNISNEAVLEEFNSTLLGFEYRITIQPIDNQTAITIPSAEVSDILQMATVHTCVNIVDNDRITAARLIVSIWEAP
ncbi:MAG: hypothetical protein KAR56_04775 [Thermoplasmata archaeon]|nr:hypothetical protein [Thermoplasmata archaeon]